MKIRKFNESNSYITDDEFEEMRKKVHQKLDELESVYTDFTINISPKHWRSSSDLFSSIRKSREKIDEYKMIEDKQIENEYYNEDYMDWYKEKYPNRNKARKYNI